MDIMKDHKINFDDNITNFDKNIFCISSKILNSFYQLKIQKV